MNIGQNFCSFWPDTFLIKPNTESMLTKSEVHARYKLRNGIIIQHSSNEQDHQNCPLPSPPETLSYSYRKNNVSKSRNKDFVLIIPILQGDHLNIHWYISSYTHGTRRGLYRLANSGTTLLSNSGRGDGRKKMPSIISGNEILFLRQLLVYI
jgi:hypothetical protein